MAASYPLAAMLAVACFFVALLPTSAAPVMTHEMGPHDVTRDTNMNMANTEVTTDQEIENLQEAFVVHSSDMLLKYIINLAKERVAHLAAGTTTECTALVDEECNIHRRFLRDTDSKSGYSANLPEGHAANLSSDHTAEFTGYPATDAVPSHYDADPHGIAKYAPSHYIPASARTLTHSKTPTQAHSPTPTLVHTPASAQASTLEHTAASVPAPALAHTPEFAPSPAPVRPKSILDIWNKLLTKPLQGGDKFVAQLPPKAIKSLLFDYQNFDFESVRDYRADKEGFVTAMQKVYQVPREQLGEVGNFFDMMTKVLPSKFFGKERSLADLIRQIRFYFAMKHPSVKVMASETVAHYYFK